MPSRAAAIRQLLNIGLRVENQGVANPARRSQDFGLLGKDTPEGIKK
jgi:hypothetical protein